MLYIKQIIPIIEPVHLSLLGYKLRTDVHQDGDWHIGIQAHILRSDQRGSFEVLTQQRSDKVDIGRSLYDQSLAVQLDSSDKMSLDSALSRGLKEELGVTKFTALLWYLYQNC